MKDNSLLQPFASGTPDVNTSDRAALDCGARGDNLSAGGVLRNQITHELQVFGIRVVGVEVGYVGSSNGSWVKQIDQRFGLVTWQDRYAYWNTVPALR